MPMPMNAFARFSTVLNAVAERLPPSRPATLSTPTPGTSWDTAEANPLAAEPAAAAAAPRRGDPPPRQPGCGRAGAHRAGDLAGGLGGAGQHARGVTRVLLRDKADVGAVHQAAGRQLLDDVLRLDRLLDQGGNRAWHGRLREMAGAPQAPCRLNVTAVRKL